MAFFTREYEWMAYLGSIISFCIAFIVVVKLFRRNKERKSEILGTVFGMALCLGLAAFLDFVFFTVNKLTTVDWIYFVHFGSDLSFSMNGIANILLIIFDQKVFRSKQKMSWQYGIILLQFVIIGGLFVTLFMDQDDFIFLGLHIINTMIIGTLITYDSFSLKRKLKIDSGDSNQTEQKALTMISYSGIALIFAVIFFVLHEIFNMIEIPREYWTVALGWVMGALSAVFIYLGYVVPGWARKMWERPKKQNKN